MQDMYSTVCFYDFTIKEIISVGIILCKITYWTIWLRKILPFLTWEMKINKAQAMISLNKVILKIKRLYIQTIIIKKVNIFSRIVH